MMKFLASFELEHMHVWCPSTFVYFSNECVGFSAWPKSAGFDGWRRHSRIMIAEWPRQAGRVVLRNVRSVDLEASPYVAHHNPRFVVAGDQLHLFFNGIFANGRCDVGYANLTPNHPEYSVVRSGILGERFTAEGQGPTNPSPWRDGDGRWRMLFRIAAGEHAERHLYEVSAASPEGPWTCAAGAPVMAGDLEDPCVWMENGTTRALVRDMTGAVTGKTWAAIGMAARDDAGGWSPAAPAHILNRSLPGPETEPAHLYSRVERPWVMPSSASGGRRLLASTYDAGNEATRIQAFAWDSMDAFLDKGEPIPATLVKPAAAPATPVATAQADDGLSDRARSLVRQIKDEKLTYLSDARLASIAREVETLRNKNARGKIVEFGVALGGSSALMASLKGPGLSFHAYDVFGMIPPPGPQDDPRSHERHEDIRAGKSEGIGGEDYYGYVDDLQARVAQTLARYGAPVDGESVVLHPGLFADTVGFDDGDVIQLAHIDCDWYEGTRLCLEAVAKVMPQWGVILIDDFSDWAGCRKATHEFLAENPDFLLREVQPHAVIRRFTTDQLAQDAGPAAPTPNPSRDNLDVLVGKFAAMLAPGSLVLDAGSASAPYRGHFSHCTFKTADMSGNVDYKGDLCDLPIPDNTFDGMICTQVLEHVPTPQAALIELLRVLKPGGRLMLSAPFFYEPHLLPHDYFRFTNHGLDHVMQQAGFEIEDTCWLEGYSASVHYFLESTAAILEKLPPGDPLRAQAARLKRISPAFLQRERDDPLMNAGYPKSHVYFCRKPA